MNSVRVVYSVISRKVFTIENQNIVMRCTAILEEKEVYIETEANSIQYKK
jgi:hypothetical protein